MTLNLIHCYVQECRPATNPFKLERGRKVVSVCMDPTVIEKYKKALNGDKSSSSTTTKTGNSGSSGITYDDGDDVEYDDIEYEDDVDIGETI